MNLTVSEGFDHLIEHFIDREDPNTMSFEALEQAARLQLAEVTIAQVEIADTKEQVVVHPEVIPTVQGEVA
jgi:hypothetical protein